MMGQISQNAHDCIFSDFYYIVILGKNFAL